MFVFCFIDDQSTEMAGLTQPQFVKALTDIRPDPEKLGFHSLAMSVWNGHPYEQVIDALGGLHWLFTGYEHEAMFAAMAHTVEPTNVFQIADLPVLETLRVQVRPPDGTPIELDADDVHFHPTTLTVDLGDFLPPDGSVVEIRYAPLGSARLLKSGSAA